GRGTLALFPQPVFRSYAKQPSAELRAILRGLLCRHVVPPRVELSVPLKMDFAIVEGRACLYVHLLNPNVEPSLCCGLMETYEGRFERSYEYMEEEAPVHDVRILVHDPTVRGARAMREGSVIDFARVPDGAEIRVACVRLWEVVKIELGEK
ncbi:MAG TPA: hypothetical protein VHE79_07445, partial [Spirochaetia bacterium]